MGFMAKILVLLDLGSAQGGSAFGWLDMVFCVPFVVG
jgi:hypothetical protein